MKTLKKWGAALHWLVVALVAAVMSSLNSLFGRRVACWNAEGTAGTHPDGMVTRTLEAALPSRHLLVQKGTADSGVILNIATTRPLGPVADEGAIGHDVAVAVLGSSAGTRKLVAAKAIAVDARLFTTAGGKVTDTFAAGAFYLGTALTAASGDGVVFEARACAPLLSATGTTF